MNVPASFLPFLIHVPFRILRKSPPSAKAQRLSLSLSHTCERSPVLPEKASWLATSEPIEPGIEEMLSLRMAHLLFFSRSPIPPRPLGFSRFFHFSPKPFLTQEISSSASSTPIREPKRGPTQYPMLHKLISPSGSSSDDFVLLETTGRPLNSLIVVSFVPVGKFEV